MPATKLQRKKAIALDHSELFDIHKWSEYPEVNAAVAHLFACIHANDPSIQAKKGKRFLKIIILDLLAKYYADPTLYSAISRSKPHYSKLASRYNKLHFNYDSMIKVLNGLVELNYIEQHMGFYNPEDPESSRMTRIKATPDLIGLLIEDHHIVEGLIEKAPDTECIILRKINSTGEKQVDIDYEDNQRTREMRKALCQYNNLLRQNFISIPEAFDEGIPMGQGYQVHATQNEKFVRRVFNNASWEEGGRFYGGWWQRIPREWREKIRIWDLPTTEIDYSGLHIVLLYGLKGVDYWSSVGHDPYKVDGLEHSERMRILLKLVLLSAINSRSKEEAIKAVRLSVNTELERFDWVKQEHVEIGNIIDMFQETHRLISDYFFSGFGVNLQYMDSVIAEYVINHFTQERRLPVLCVHDSFIIQAQSKDELESVMSDAISEARHQLTQLIISPELQSKVKGVSLTRQDILTTSKAWQEQANQMRAIYRKYPRWKKALEEFDEMQHREEYIDDYYVSK